MKITFKCRDNKNAFRTSVVKCDERRTLQKTDVHIDGFFCLTTPSKRDKIPDIYKKRTTLKFNRELTVILKKVLNTL
jgi:hypothetical protein